MGLFDPKVTEVFWTKCPFRGTLSDGYGFGYRKILKRNVFEMSLAHNEIKKVTPSYALLVTKRRYFKFLVHKLYRGFFRG